MAYQQAADRYLKALEATLAPDLVCGVYVVGSAALGSWRPGRSDLDVLVVLDRPLTPYWRNHVNHRSRLAQQEPGSAVDPYLLAWEATGPGRLHATIATGKVISKEASADYTARLFPKYADLCAKAKAYRMGDETVTCTTAEALRVIDLIEAVCNSAKELP